MKRRKLPAGVQTFREIRDDGFYYVDKTAHIRRLVAQGKHYFLSRPRRFGKSLLVDTLKELFEGNERLFRGLAIHDCWDWAQRHPVVRLSFAAGSFDEPAALAANFADSLSRLERKAGVVAEYASPEGRLTGLIESLHEQTGQRVVLLVDEYDRPIADALGDSALAKKNRSFLRAVYGVAKDCDAMIRFSLFTGVSKFPKVSIFSDLNNLIDITLDVRFATLCGYTEDELDAVFEAELEGLDRETIRDWYNGYCWRGGERVYNPFGMLLLLQNREFRPYWFETGTPAFLPDTLLSRKVDPAALDGLLAGDADLAAFDVDYVKTEALLFQTGYLTILEEERTAAGYLYRLGYPNREVRSALNLALLATMAPGLSAVAECSRLARLLAQHDFAGVEALFRAFFAGVPYQWYTNNDIAHYEGYYSAVFYSHCVGAGLDVIPEASSGRGRADLVVRHGGGICVFEFKKVGIGEEGRPSSALAQMESKRYADTYRAVGVPIHLIGVEFSAESRNISAFDVALLRDH